MNGDRFLFMITEASPFISREQPMRDQDRDE